MAFRLYSNDLQDGGKLPQQQVFNGMGYHGDNLSPHLAWDGVPAGTKSFVIAVYDPDAPTGSGWWHWIVANIPADVRELPQGAGSGKAPLPAGAADPHRLRLSRLRRRGAASGESHRYQFTVHALDVERIEVDEGSSGALVGFNVHFHSLGSATLTVTFN
ncbi:kinase inhibitor [Serratia ureilytica]